MALDLESSEAHEVPGNREATLYVEFLNMDRITTQASEVRLHSSHDLTTRTAIMRFWPLTATIDTLTD